MEIRFANLTADLSDPIDISIPLYFNGPQPNAFGVDAASSEACTSGDMVGDTRGGGSCNFERYTLIPHCNGTHTECVGHITNKRIAVRDCLRDSFVAATVVSIEPTSAAETNESYPVAFGYADRLITRTSLEQAVMAAEAKATALVVRTLPNDDSKLTRLYGKDIPPYFTTEAIEMVLDNGFDHLIVDLPSIDRIYDEGKLSNHRMFWNVEPGSFEVSGETRMRNTITELAFVPNVVVDGLYLLNLQIAPFTADASPSRPLLFRTWMS